MGIAERDVREDNPSSHKYTDRKNKTSQELPRPFTREPQCSQPI